MNAVLGRRSFLCGFSGTVMLGGMSCKARSQASDAIATLPDHRRSSDLDDTEALYRALARAPSVYFPGGRGSGVNGEYRIGSTAEDNLPAGIRLFGDGPEHTIVARSYARPAAFILHCDSGSGSAHDNIKDLLFRDMTFYDDVERLGFSEYAYLVMLNGVSRARFDRVHFRGFRGDGLHLGSSVMSNSERHNRDVVVSNCVFDGVNCNNRNAISVIDCDGLTVEQSQFLNCSRPGNGGTTAEDPMDPATGSAMPGPIDLEPNRNAFAIIRNITIRHNNFVGGGGYAVALNLLPNDFVDVPQSDFHIHDNEINARWGGLHTSGYGADGKSAELRPYRIVFENNAVTRCAKPFIIDGIVGLMMKSNRFDGSAAAAELGYSSFNKNIALVDNQFLKLGSQDSGYGLWIRSIDVFRMANNVFADIGLADRKFGIAVAFVQGEISHVKMARNRFVSPLGRTTEALTVFRDARVEKATLTHSDNHVSFAAPSIADAIGVAAELR